jgi:hypothetical protein
VLAGIVLWPVIALLLPLIGPANMASIVSIAAAMVVLNAVQLVLFRGQPSMRRIETIGAITCVLNGIAVIVLSLVGGLPEMSFYAVPGLMFVAIYAFVVYQLPWGPGLIAAGVIVAACALSPIQHGSTARGVLELVLLAGGMGLGALASYLLEGSARERYLQGRVIESQAAEIAERRPSRTGCSSTSFPRTSRRGCAKSRRRWPSNSKPRPCSSPTSWASPRCPNVLVRSARRACSTTS